MRAFPASDPVANSADATSTDCARRSHSAAITLVDAVILGFLCAGATAIRMWLRGGIRLGDIAQPDPLLYSESALRLAHGSFVPETAYQVRLGLITPVALM